MIRLIVLLLDGVSCWFWGLIANLIVVVILAFCFVVLYCCLWLWFMLLLLVALVVSSWVLALSVDLSGPAGAFGLYL